MVVSIAIFFAIGCATSGGDAATAPRATPRVVSVPSATSPLAELIGFSSDSEINRQQFVAIQQRSDALVADCMSSQGYEWAPTPAQPGSALASGNRVSLAWARAHGLGVTDQLVALSRATPLDPNAGYVGTLNEQDQQRWQVALRGDTSSLESNGDEPVVYVPAGCLGAAFAATRPWSETYQAFEQDLRTLAKRVEADPRSVAHQAVWASCMAGAGHPHADLQSMNDDIVTRLLEIPGVPELLTSTEPLSASESAGLTDVLQSPDFMALVELEQDVAVANVDCAAQFATEARDVRDSYERRFIIDHQVRLDEAVVANPHGP